MNLALVDVETNGLYAATSHVLEIGVVLWSVTHGVVIAAWSDLVQHDSNDAESTNRIPVPALADGTPFDVALARLRHFVGRADIIVAHNAEFDESFLPGLDRQWLCSEYDFAWPCAPAGQSLINLALAHGVAVTHAHRALTDVLLLSRLFERVREMGHDIPAMIAHASRPKAKFQAMVSYADKDLAKERGFRWDPSARRWTRRMAIEDAEKLPFSTKIIESSTSHSLQ